MTQATTLADIKPEQLVAGIREWVSLETPPNDVPRLVEFAERAAHQARQAGLAVELIPVNNTQQPLVRIRAHSEGSQSNQSNEKTVLVLAHYDTVHPIGTVERNRVRIEMRQAIRPRHL